MHILSVPMCSCVVTVKFCCIKTRLEIHSSRVRATCFCVIMVFSFFETSLCLFCFDYIEVEDLVPVKMIDRFI